MYHFAADHPPVPVRLSFRALVPGHVRQYLKQFQIDAIQFMHNFLAKGEFCCYNDESGLGKQAAVSVLLDAACGNKKTLIIVQNDDCYVNGWEFHFSVLTNSSVMVIKEKKDSTNTPHNVYIAKWSTLRAIDDLSKFDFDFIILDNRGQMLNNSFCTSMLLKHYERKINILISSVDITSDLKLLHNILKLGGRLDPRYTSFKTFEEKFKLPDAKELAYKKVDLEDYFLRRERLADYCKHYRLRRYCHQFEQQLPLVEEDRYKINLDIWREKQNATNSEGSSVEVASQNRPNERIRDTQELFEEYCRQRRKLQEREKLKQQLEQEKQQEQQREQKQKEQEQKRIEAEKEQETDLEIIYNVDDEVAFINATPPVMLSQLVASRDNTDDVLLMSPLLVVSDSEDPDDVPQICNDPNDDTNIVDLSSDDENDNIETPNKNCEKDKNVTEGEKTIVKIDKPKNTGRSEADRLRADVATNLKFQNETTPKRRTRHEEEVHRLSTTRRREIVSSERRRKEVTKTSIANKTKNDVIKAADERNNNEARTKKKDNQQGTTRSGKVSAQERQKTSGSATNKEKQITKKDNQHGEKKSPVKQSASVLENVKDCAKSKVTNSTENDAKNGDCSTSQSSLSKSRQTIQENTTTNPSLTSMEKGCQRQSTNEAKVTTNPIVSELVIKKEPEDVYVPQTRRSNINMMARLERIKRELDVDHMPLHNRDTRSMQRSTRSNVSNSKYSYTKLSLHNEKAALKPKKKPQEKNKCSLKQNPQAKKSKPTEDISDTQAPVISMTCSQDYERIQCAQRLSDVGVLDNNTQRNSPEFLVPHTPVVITRNSLIPSSLTSSNGFFADSDVLFVPPSAPKGGSNSASGKKQNEDVIILSGSETENSSSVNMSSTSRRTRALKPRRMQNIHEEAGKVPTFSQLLAQHNTRKSTKSPDLFSNCSEIGQLTLSQPPVNTEDEPNAPFEGFKIFGSEVKQLQQHYALAKIQNPLTSSKKAYRDRSCLDILENMFEPPNKKLKSKDTTTTYEANNQNTQIKRVTQKTRTQNPIVPHHPIEAIAEAQAQKEMKQKRSLALPLNEDEIFEITNNGTFGSVMRLHSNGEISPVQQTQKSTKIPNKITKYFMGGLTQNLTGSQEDSGNNSESGTPSKKQPQAQTQISNTQYITSKKSPKQKCPSTQVTKLTKWFTKNSPNKQLQTQVSDASTNIKQTSSGKRQVKRRRLDLTQVTDDTD